MNLLIDAGNSRVKWAWSDGGRIASDQVSLAHDGAPGAEWLKLVRAAGYKPLRAFVSNVAGADFASKLAKVLRDTFGVEPEFARVTAAAAGVTCAYRDPSQLGVDRWLAAIGGWHVARGPVCILDAGTATTVDAVDAGGQHLGGMIVPGLDLMEDSLLKRTSDIARVIGMEARAQATLFADNTAAGVRNGAAFATAALADRAVGELERRAGGSAKLFVTGGNAARVAPCLAKPAQVVPDLVLQGLRVLYEGAGTGG